MIRLCLAVLGAVALSGCASSLGTFFNRPVVEDSIQDHVTTVSLAADRRVVVVSHVPDRLGKFCAEPPPDSTTGLKTEVDATLKKQAYAELGLKDKLETTITVLANQRTANLDMFRTGVYALCQYSLNGSLSQGEVGRLFERLIKAYETVEANIASAKPPVDKK